MVTPTEYGTLWIHVRPSNTSVADEFRPAEVGPVFVDDAWASMGAFTLGRRCSFFDYNPGFNHKPGYTSYLYDQRFRGDVTGDRRSLGNLGSGRWLLPAA